MTTSLLLHVLPSFLIHNLYALVAYDEEGYPVDEEEWDEDLDEDFDEEDDDPYEFEDDDDDDDSDWE